jgi:hypothetical protein
MIHSRPPWQKPPTRTELAAGIHSAPKDIPPRSAKDWAAALKRAQDALTRLHTHAMGYDPKDSGSRLLNMEEWAHAEVLVQIAEQLEALADRAEWLLHD